ncbi:MAG: T9SS type A sorting domain-containing protein, partial [Syntrophothermus sp.]
AGQDVTGIENNYVAGCFTEKWQFPKTVINSQNHSALIKNVTQSGDWTLGVRDALYPSQISLKYSLNSNKIVVSWQVPSDYRNYSFTLERADYWLKDWKPVAGMDELQKGKYGENFTYTDSPPTGKFRYRLKQIASDGDLLYSEDIEVTLDRPGSYSLEQNFPNPFNSDTRINYSIPADSKVYLVVFSVTGQIVAELVNEYKSAGRYSVSLDASGLASGTYIYKIMAGSFVQTKKMIVLR